MTSPNTTQGIVGNNTLERESLILLCHRIPYPPNKGDKIRAWHLLNFLAARFDVYLGTFVDDKQDWIHVPTVSSVCAKVEAVPLSPLVGKARSLRGLLSGEALSIPYYGSRRLEKWVTQISRHHQVRKFVVFSSVMGQFLPHDRASSNVVVDFVDVDSDKWRQYAATVSGPMSWLYRREARALLSYEIELANSASRSLFVSEAEARFFAGVDGVPENRVGYYSNGVDANYFDPHLYPDIGCERELVFTGAMDYWPNVDAVVWFAQKVFPALREVYPDLRFTIVGGKPDDRVRQLERQVGIEVTGRVPDVRPYLARALAAVAPMRVARGVQNKVLEGMAMARPVITSAMGLEGIDASPNEHVIVAESSDDYLGALRTLDSSDARAALGASARDLVLRQYAWESTLKPLGEFLDGRECEAMEAAYA